MTSQGETTKRFSQAAIEAANRAEATALLIRCGFRVYRPEADIEGEDLVLRQPAGMLIPVQLKPRIYVDGQRYSGLGLFMLFPLGPFTPAAPRPWFLTPHDPLYAEVEKRHGHTPKWTGRWHSAYPGSALREYLAPFEVTPPAEPEAPEPA
ncbi:hypothetical protein BHAOGJBA_0177 [Methylobacterium hispanicum]|uniref:DUF4365 domain-containing protein n=1 Tax=Methylobacterium hispanicum TaxID=270350 RepID=A0AAV4ZEP8_9HYPH|nr:MULTISPECIES: hypothetical protein [Methylobacterium]GJD86682.1 hypothetical protein BHAOGJBA_0177 [Methylobacterium hispanicum]